MALKPICFTRRAFLLKGVGYVSTSVSATLSEFVSLSEEAIGNFCTLVS